jgi:hypothetical protein
VYGQKQCRRGVPTEAEAAVKELHQSGFDLKQHSSGGSMGQGFHSHPIGIL